MLPWARIDALRLGLVLVGAWRSVLLGDWCDPDAAKFSSLVIVCRITADPSKGIGPYEVYLWLV